MYELSATTVSKCYLGENFCFGGRRTYFVQSEPNKLNLYSTIRWSIDPFDRWSIGPSTNRGTVCQSLASLFILLMRCFFVGLLANKFASLRRFLTVWIPISTPKCFFINIFTSTAVFLGSDFSIFNI